MNLFRSKRVLGVVAALLLALFLVRPRVGVLHQRIVQTLSAEIGRPVEIASVHIRFLPRPGLELRNLSIYENDGSRGEPLLRSPEVTGWLRVSSLLRGRIEISRLGLTNASLNLGRNAEGRWNIQDLLERTSRSSTAPTGANRKEPRREFPYVDGDHARINFKNGLEKTHFALANAEFSLWQDSENQWGMRLRGSPIRTDANLTDTGTISLSGTWLRSAVLADTPVQVSFQWKQAQIGQVSKLVTGFDKEWRGDLGLSGTISGSMGNPRVAVDVAVDEFRKGDVLASGDLQFRAHCAAQYSFSAATLRDFSCHAPAGAGLVEISGNLAEAPLSYNFKLRATSVPAESLVQLARHAGYSTRSDLSAAGSMNLDASLVRDASSLTPEFKAQGEIIAARLDSANARAELQLGTIPLKLVTPKAPARKSDGTSPTVAPAWDSELQLGPVNLQLGRPTAVQAQFSVSRAGYKALVHGDAGLKGLLNAARIFQLPAPQVNAEGGLTINLALSRQWNRPPAVTGTAELRAVHAQVRGLNSPLQIHRADLAIAADAVRVANVDASAGTSRWHGGLVIPRPCSWPDACNFEFRLHSPQLSAGDLNQLLNPSSAKHPWYHLLAIGGSGTSFFAKASARGSISIDKLVLGSTACARFSADVSLGNDRVSLTNVRANVMSGRASGELKADFSVRPPMYSGAGQLDDVSLASVAAITGGGWAEGEAATKYRFSAQGWKIHDLLNSAELNANFRIDDAVFPHVALTDSSGALEANTFAGELSLREGQFSFTNAKLESEAGVFNVSGTATLHGGLNLTMTGDNTGAYALSGTLAETRVTPLANPPTQAALKP